MTYKQRLASPLIWAANYLGLLDTYSFLRRRLVTPGAIILLYHQVTDEVNQSWSLGPVALYDFENQIRYLCQRYEVVSLDKLGQSIQEGKALSQRTAVITFDDGYKGNYLHAYPILKKYNVPATIFLATGYIGTGNMFWTDKVRYIILNTPLETLNLGKLGTYSLKNSSDRLQASSQVVSTLKQLPEQIKNVTVKKLTRVSEVDIPISLEEKYTLSWEEVREMSDNGIDFGAHTVMHPLLTRISLEQARYEITQSKREIEHRLGKPVVAFSYPFGGLGEFKAETTKLVKEAGFRYAVTSIPRMVTLKTDLYELGRITPKLPWRLFKFITSDLYLDLRAMWS